MYNRLPNTAQASRLRISQSAPTRAAAAQPTVAANPPHGEIGAPRSCAAIPAIGVAF
jgi:hypothetical protein